MSDGKQLENSKDAAKMCDTHIMKSPDECAATITIVDPFELIDLARNYPVDAAANAQAAMTTLRTGFKRQRAKLICVGYASAYHMVRTDGAWEKFIRDPGWLGLSKKPKNNLRGKNRILHHVLRYIFRAEAKDARDRVRVYANMLLDRFNKGVQPTEIVMLIEKHGIERLRKEGEAARSAAAAAADMEKFLNDLNKVDQDEENPYKRREEYGEQFAKGAQSRMIIKALANLNAQIFKIVAKESDRLDD